MSFSADPLADLLDKNLGESTDSLNTFRIGKKAKSLQSQTNSSGYVQKSAQSLFLHENEEEEFDDDNDELGFDPKKPKAASKTSILDDILGVTLGDASTSEKAIASDTTVGATTAELRGDLGKRPATTGKATISRQSTHTDTTDNSALRPKTSTGRRSSNSSIVHNADTLGLFTLSKGNALNVKEKSNTSNSPKTKQRGTPIDWLGLNMEAKELNEPNTPEIDAARKREGNSSSFLTVTDVEKPIRAANDLINIETKSDDNSNLKPSNVDVTLHTIMGIRQLNDESQTAISVLSQQESQLSAAMRIKAQEKMLFDMKHQQEELLQRQERQFGELFQQQLERQLRMEEHIVAQQQRINAHINLLMAQSNSNMMNIPLENKNIDPQNQEQPPNQQKNLDVNSSIQFGCDIRRLETEKTNLEDLLTTMKAHYEKQFEIMEESYKKQLAVLDGQKAAIEIRLRSSIEDINEHYSQKFAAVQQEIQNSKTAYEAEIVRLKQKHELDIKNLHLSHERTLELIKDEHYRMLEHVRESKLKEIAAIQDSGTQLEVLRSASNELQGLTDGLQSLQDDMNERISSLNQVWLKRVQLREKKLEEFEKQYQLKEDAAKIEKQRLMEIVESLEVQLKSLLKNTQDQNASLMARSVALDNERAAFEKTKQDIMEKFRNDERCFNEFKKRHIVDSSKLMEDLCNERIRLASERSKLEIERSLYNNVELQRLREEAETRISAANEAVRKAEEERHEIQRIQRELELSKREIEEKESLLRRHELNFEMEESELSINKQKLHEAKEKLNDESEIQALNKQELVKRWRELMARECEVSRNESLNEKTKRELEDLRKRILKHKCGVCRMLEPNGEVESILEIYTNEKPLSTSCERLQGGVDVKNNNKVKSIALCKSEKEHKNETSDYDAISIDKRNSAIFQYRSHCPNCRFYLCGPITGTTPAIFSHDNFNEQTTEDYVERTLDQNIKNSVNHMHNIGLRILGGVSTQKNILTMGYENNHQSGNINDFVGIDFEEIN